MPVAVEAPMLIVRTDVAEPSIGGVTKVGLKVPVAPAGRPEIERLTAELKPFNDVIVIVEVPEPPWTIVRVVGEAEIEKSGGAAIVSEIVTVCVKVPLVPVTVRVEVPRVAVAETVIVRVEVAELPEGGVTEVGLNVVVTPVGAPDTERLTAELKALTEVTVTVEVPEAP